MGIIFTESKKLTVTALILDLIYIAASLVFNFFSVSVIYGALLGYLFMILNFSLLGTTIENAFGMSEKRASRYLKANYVVRYIITGIVLAISASSDKIDLWIVILSLLAPKITYTAIGFYHSIFKKEEKEEE